MILIKPNYKILSKINGNDILENIEDAGRIYYQSEHKKGPGSYIDFAKKIVGNGHESVIEHEKVTVKFVIDRGVSHELVRHRIASFSQESTRYCNYNNELNL